MQKWEYEVVDLEALVSKVDSEEDERDVADVFKELLNEKSKHGWELVGAMEVKSFLVFKKLKHRSGNAP